MYLNQLLIGYLAFKKENKMTFITTPFVRSFVGFDSLFDELEKVSNFKESGFPAYNIEKIDQYSYEISVALAGYNEKDLKIELRHNILKIESNNEKRGISKNYLHKGIATRGFSKKFRLAENIEVNNAIFQNGLLTIRLQSIVNEKDLPKIISINASQKSAPKQAA
jgi:molecular chaperone IbpA